MIKKFSKITVAVILSVVIAVTSCVSSGAKISKFNELQTYTADVDCSGTIDIFDATLIQKYLAKMYVY